MKTITKEDLIAFEEELKEPFERGEIKAPVHFSGGNEDVLIQIFQGIRNEDWVFSTHRSHYHALLKGIDRKLLKQEILNGHSICLNNEEKRFFSSAIVAGIAPIAVGLAASIMLRQGTERVWAFVGDMAAETGLFYESMTYAERNGLPIMFVIEDNGYSVNTPTQQSWGASFYHKRIIRYSYARTYPHHGTGKWVTF